MHHPKKHPEDLNSSDLRRAAQSDAGQKLLSKLRENNSQQVSEALSQASSGDYAQARKTLDAILSDPAIRSLALELRRQLDG